NNDLKLVMAEIYYGWIKEFKKRLANMIVPAVIEHQIVQKLVAMDFQINPNSKFTIDQLLNFLSALKQNMRCYHMDESMSRQILTELLRVIGVQIQYNVSRLEEWCTGHGIAEATLHLQQLLQAAKLLTLNKTSASDIEIIFDVCFLLNPTQIKKLLSLYYAADFDSPLSTDLLKIVSNRAANSDKTESLLLDLDASPEFVHPEPRTVKHIERFIPAWTSLPKVTAVISSQDSMSPTHVTGATLPKQ
ncbi:Myosin type-2 heavy chain 1, partial [Kappamyces sp. JEL0680]